MMNRSKAFYKIASIIIAITLWSYVMVNSEPTQSKTIRDIPVQLINEENLTARNLSLAGETDYTVSVKIRGRKSEIVKMQANQIQAKADLFGYTPGSNYVNVSVSVPDTIQVVDVNESQIVVNIEELVAQSKPVVVNFEGEFKEDTEAGGVTTQPEAIEVSGPRSLVDQVDHIKVAVNASKVKSDGGSVQSKAQPVSADGTRVEGVELSSDAVEVYAKLLHIKEVDLEVPLVGEVSPAYEVTKQSYPKKIKIRGAESLLKGIDKITSNPIDVSNVTTNTTVLIAPILPDGVELADSSKGIALSIQLKGITEKVFEYSAFEISTENVPDNLNLTVNTEKIQLKIAGKEAAINEMSKSDFDIYIDLKDATTDLSVAEVLVRHEKAVTTLQVVPEQVNIVLSEVE